MKKLILILLIIPFISSCFDNQEPVGSIDVSVTYEYDEGANGTYPVASPHAVYLFEDINFAIGPFSYIGSGRVKNDNTGEIIESTKMNRLDGGITKFDGLSLNTYGIVLDMLDTKIKASRATSINLKTYNGDGELSFLIDIWPYDPWDL